ncbi:hypothetical protein CFR78_04600 [Komagataeibacter rhaeticus]|uniref:alpha-1,4-glucan--maltose-1-phosphate maltosyltransferase n=1 Tax=Komagataeibacter rhaeticus TaxID=215221 RepID=UPI0004D4C4AD|nr:alpha-1,4-glucan--maltose-1-phosphate maltosyltransferase [Komagataeibacter rhaeticus]KDU97429.1 hypothetical protein GLUCORHAEAF1_02095 [Komagataeibacter rhaeticus AF1]MBL7238975.1 DUF3416 domain-containing protein [Komagataeibacter rhaeticus]PYD54247.1 hypothetical protein CFR78_04600 [Komagataeibacter rhaeticus]GBQ15015.1 alpha amylase [Komagataeibacter rhaeticus DSM 16663]
MEEQTVTTRSPPRTPAPAWTPFIQSVHPATLARPQRWEAVLSRCADAGFTEILVAPLFASGADPFLVSSHHETGSMPAWTAPLPDSLGALARLGRRHGLAILLDLPLDRIARDGALARHRPQWCLPDGADARAARLDYGAHEAEIVAYWQEITAMLLHAGIAGFRCDAPQRLPVATLARIIAATRQVRPGCRWIGWTVGLDHAGTLAIAATGVDMVASSVAWWDRTAPWLGAERHGLPPHTGLLACPVPLAASAAVGNETPPGMALRLAAAIGDGVLVPAGFGDPPDAPGQADGPLPPYRPALHAALRHAGRMVHANALPVPTNRDMPVMTVDGLTVMTRQGDTRRGEPAPLRLVLVNPSTIRPAQARLAPLLAERNSSFAFCHAIDGEPDFAPSPTGEVTLAPGAIRVLQVRPQPALRRPVAPATPDLRTLPRIVIEAVAPSVDAGRFPARAVTGDSVAVEADIFMDGHDLLRARVLWRPEGDATWRHAAMQPIGNSRWRGYIAPDRVGPWVFTIEAWRDDFGTYVRDLARRRAAGVMDTADIADGRALLEHTMHAAPAPVARELAPMMDHLATLDHDRAAELLLAPTTATMVEQADRRPFHATLAAPLRIWVDRGAARFGNWYELFPRSLGTTPGAHGTLRDVIGRLPAIRAMGFGVLYLPPIHPIGHVNRKGANNARQARAGDPGSPYAIGSSAGGHDAIHPELGTMADFDALVAAVRGHGMELALDFAIQCAPDHPWLAAHPEWFAHRADGTLHYAENPPKKYEDIVNVDFYAPTAIPPLWQALLDIVLFWVDRGVRIFRVDNPHTKPLPFWEWLIGQVQAPHPDVLFLAEAFTAPKMMYRLAKAGFTQSYTYFTWRTTKAELIAYMTELTTPPVSDFFRPHFFVNTPDINPLFVQESGRAGHLIRAALACTLSGLWGLYAGFELCDATALPGREEYLDSEKYQIRQRDWAAPGNIIAEITALNALRLRHRALQSHMGLRFYTIFNDRIVYFGKMAPDQSDMILVAISLDPEAAQEADFEIPLWEWKLSDNASLLSHDLLDGRHAVWTGRIQHVRLDPRDRPHAIWQVSPAGGTAP